MKPLSGWLAVAEAWHECIGDWGFKILYQGPDEREAIEAAEDAFDGGARRVHVMPFSRKPGARSFTADFSDASLLPLSRAGRGRRRRQRAKRLRELRGLADVDQVQLVNQVRV